MRKPRRYEYAHLLEIVCTLLSSDIKDWLMNTLCIISCKAMIPGMCNIDKEMPPHYYDRCTISCSAKGIRINDVYPVNDKQLGLEIQDINCNANAANQDMVVVGSGGRLLVGTSVIQWIGDSHRKLILIGLGTQ